MSKPIIDKPYHRNYIALATSQSSAATSERFRTALQRAADKLSDSRQHEQRGELRHLPTRSDAAAPDRPVRPPRGAVSNLNQFAERRVKAPLEHLASAQHTANAPSVVVKQPTAHEPGNQVTDFAHSRALIEKCLKAADTLAAHAVASAGATIRFSPTVFSGATVTLWRHNGGWYLQLDQVDEQAAAQMAQALPDLRAAFADRGLGRLAVA